MITFPIAKINLGLNVVEKRPDGYHNLQTVFFPVPIKDALEVYPMDAEFPSQVDCRICGYQTCKAFSEAIVNNEADVRQCIFVQRILEQTDKLTTPEALKLMRKVWGEKKIEKHSIKHLDLE